MSWDFCDEYLNIFYELLNSKNAHDIKFLNFKSDKKAQNQKAKKVEKKSQL